MGWGCAVDFLVVKEGRSGRRGAHKKEGVTWMEGLRALSEQVESGGCVVIELDDLDRRRMLRGRSKMIGINAQLGGD